MQLSRLLSLAHTTPPYTGGSVWCAEFVQVGAEVCAEDRAKTSHAARSSNTVERTLASCMFHVEHAARYIAAVSTHARCIYTLLRSLQRGELA